jgi:undecaprenyl-diphosphatase
VIEGEADGLAEAIDAALAGGAEVVGVAGGDGTVSCAAQRVLGTDATLLVIPAGTRNHFAHDLGVDDVEAAARAATGTRRIAVDLGDVNGHVFVNNASLGTYARLVQKRERYEGRYGKRVANVIAAWSELRHGRHVTLEVDGTPTRVWAVFIGNGAYGEGLRDVTRRESLQEGQLDVWVVRSRGRFSRVRVTFAVLFGRLDGSPLIDRVQTASLTVGGRQRRIPVACDGEVEPIDTPLTFSVKRGALSVAVPDS